MKIINEIKKEMDLMNAKQINEITKGYDLNLTDEEIYLYAKHDYDNNQMKVIKNILVYNKKNPEKQIDVNKLLNKKYNVKDMKLIASGLQWNIMNPDKIIDIDMYANIEYPHHQKKFIYECLIYNIKYPSNKKDIEFCTKYIYPSARQIQVAQQTIEWERKANPDKILDINVIINPLNKEKQMKQILEIFQKLDQLKKYINKKDIQRIISICRESEKYKKQIHIINFIIGANKYSYARDFSTKEIISIIPYIDQYHTLQQLRDLKNVINWNNEHPDFKIDMDKVSNYNIQSTTINGKLKELKYIYYKNLIKEWNNEYPENMLNIKEIMNNYDYEYIIKKYIPSNFNKVLNKQQIEDKLNQINDSFESIINKKSIIEER